VERCFELSLSVDAHRESMARSGERAVAGVTSGVMRQGDTVTWRARHFGLPFHLTSRISEYSEPTRFVDEQVKGPFAAWWHEHTFAAAGDGTVMVDRIEFRSPLGPLGRVVDRLVLRRYMTALIERRNRWLLRELCGD
jgi:ligand-binding SRPBCC domain-containing protein